MEAAGFPRDQRKNKLKKLLDTRLLRESTNQHGDVKSLEATKEDQDGDDDDEDDGELYY